MNNHRTISLMCNFVANAVRLETRIFPNLAHGTISKRSFAAEAKPEKRSTKSPLSELRKRTGFSLVNCKKALEQFDDLDAAERWLQEEAQKQGWQKASKLAGRAANQGLISILTTGSKAAVVELNCETDFVAKNERFHELLASLTDAAISHVGSRCEKGSSLTLTGEELLSMSAKEGKSCQDLIALGIVNLGENILLRRSMLFHGEEDNYFASYVHARVGSGDNVKDMGKFGAVIRFKMDNNSSDTQSVCRGLCQHVVGMNPKTLGDINDEVVKKVTEEVELDTEGPKEGDDQFEVSPDQMIPVSEKDTRFLFQDYILDNTKVVKEVVQEHGLVILDFHRFELGEQLVSEEKQESPATDHVY